MPRLEPDETDRTPVPRNSSPPTAAKVRQKMAGRKHRDWRAKKKGSIKVQKAAKNLPGGKGKGKGKTLPASSLKRRKFKPGSKLQ